MEHYTHSISTHTHRNPPPTVNSIITKGVTFFQKAIFERVSQVELGIY